MHCVREVISDGQTTFLCKYVNDDWRTPWKLQGKDLLMDNTILQFIIVNSDTRGPCSAAVWWYAYTLSFSAYSV